MMPGKNFHKLHAVVAVVGAIVLAGCRQLPLPVQLPSPTHTSKPPTNGYAGLTNFGKVTDHIWRGAQPTA